MERVFDSALWEFLFQLAEERPVASWGDQEDVGRDGQHCQDSRNEPDADESFHVRGIECQHGGLAERIDALSSDAV